MEGFHLDGITLHRICRLWVFKRIHMAGQFLKMLPTNNFIVVIVIFTIVKISKDVLILSPESFYLIHMNKVCLWEY